MMGWVRTWGWVSSDKLFLYILLTGLKGIAEHRCVALLLLLKVMAVLSEPKPQAGRCVLS